MVLWGKPPSPNQRRSPAQEFGDQLRLARESRGHTLRKVGDKIGSNIARVEALELGVELPTPKEWSRYKDMVAKRLQQFNPLYMQLRDEALARGSSAPVLSQPLAPKLTLVAPVAVVAPPIVAPPVVVVAQPASVAGPPVVIVPSTSAQPTAVPPRAPTSHEQRKAFARSVLQQHPAIKIAGAGGLQDMMNTVCGGGVGWETVSKIRDEVLREIGAGQRVQQVDPPPTTATLPLTIGPRDTTKEDVKAIVDLVLQIPNLHSLSIVIDEHGKPAVVAKMREVKTRIVSLDLD